MKHTTGLAVSVCYVLLQPLCIIATVMLTGPTSARAATYVLEDVTGNLGDTLTGTFNYTSSGGFSNFDITLHGCGDTEACGDVFTTFIQANQFSPNQINVEAANGDVLQMDLLDALTLSALTGVPGNFEPIYGGILGPLGNTTESIGASWVGAWA